MMVVLWWDGGARKIKKLSLTSSPSWPQEELNGQKQMNIFGGAKQKLKYEDNFVFPFFCDFCFFSCWFLFTSFGSKKEFKSFKKMFNMMFIQTFLYKWYKILQDKHTFLPGFLCFSIFFFGLVNLLLKIKTKKALKKIKILGGNKKKKKNETKRPKWLAAYNEKNKKKTLKNGSKTKKWLP